MAYSLRGSGGRRKCRKESAAYGHEYGGGDDERRIPADEDDAYPGDYGGDDEVWDHEDVVHAELHGAAAFSHVRTVCGV